MVSERNLPTKAQGERLGASHINVISRTVEKVNREIFSGEMPAFSQRRVKITIAGFEGETSVDGDADEELFTVRPMFWAGDGIGWEVDNDGAEWVLDCSMIMASSPQVGDELIAFYDPQRGAFLPITSPSRGTLAIRIEIRTADCEDLTAVCRILSRPVGISQVPGEYEIEENGEPVSETDETGTTVPSKFVDVIDKYGDLLNEANLHLIGRRGLALYMKGRPDNPYHPWISWELSTLMRQQSECEVL